MIFVLHRKLTYGPPRSVRAIAVLFDMYMMFVTHWKHTYAPPWNVIEIALLSYML
jgi:hypothetical protein